MTFSLFEASAPVFIRTLSAIPAWLDKAIAEGKSEQAIMEARLASDMRPFPAQIQMASDSAKNCIARLAGITAPSMPDTEASFAELKERCAKTVAFIQSVDRSAIDGAEDRDIEIKFPNGMGYRFKGRDYVAGFAIPNFFFHVSMAYALLRSEGVAMTKDDFLTLGPPIKMD